MIKKLRLVLGLLLTAAPVLAQTISLSEVSSFLLRGTTCGETTSFPTSAAAATTWNAGSARLVVPESLLSDFLGDVTVIQTNNPTIPSVSGVNEVLKVGEKLQQDVDANASNLKYRIHIPGSGEQEFADTNTIVINHLKQRWFIDQQAWPIADPDEQTQRVKDAINYIRGKHNLEQESLGPFRNRKYVKPDGSRVPWALGEIHGKPIIVSPPKMPYTELGYTQFAQAQANRPSVLFFGGGDGIIHAVYYDGPVTAMIGRHVYSFIPSAVVPPLAEYTKPEYTRRAFIDGPLEAFDLYDGSQWKTILIAAMNHGGKSITAIDITDPMNASFLFEFTHPGLGYSYSPVLLGRFLSNTAPGKKYYFLTAGGFENSNRRASVLVIDPSGTLVASVEIPNDTDLPLAENGSMSITSFDSNQDGVTDAIYIGTYQGQIYRIDTPLADTNSWTSPVLVADFSPLNITASPRVSTIQGKTQVIIGTGKLLANQDIDDMAQQYFMSFEESNSPVTLAELDRYSASWSQAFNQRYVQLSSVQNISGEKGYAIQLPDQHKFVNPALLLADGVLFTTIDPKIEENTPCTSPSGKSVLWYVSQTGHPLFSGNASMDVDRDGQVETEDLIGGKNVAGVELSSGSFSAMPLVEFAKLSLRVLAVGFYSQQPNNGIQHAGLEIISIRNRFKLKPGNRSGSSVVK